MSSDCDAVYTERNRLVAALSKFLPSYVMPATDAEDGWSMVVAIEGPAGQMSWHIPDDEIWMFHHLYSDSSKTWDGHTTDEKYQRLARLTPSWTEMVSVSPDDREWS